MVEPFAESFKIKMVEPVFRSTREQRTGWIKEARYNIFNLRSEQVYIDLLTDSGTSAMSQQQWAEMMLGDESYAGANSYYKLKQSIEDVFGFEYFLPVHQGRAAENVLFSVLVKEGNIVPGNAHFDTTRGHIEYRRATALDCTIQEAYNTRLIHPFKGNIDTVILQHVLEKYADDIPFIILTLTCNTTGGQPVSMQNMKDVRALADAYSIPLVYDAARFAENAYFIKEREDGYRDRTIPSIVTEMFSYADAITMSSKKDGNVNIGGFIAFREKDWYDKACTYNIMFEGYLTYGGMSGRDMNALACGLSEAIEYDYLDTRIKQTEYLANHLLEQGIPVQQPTGGHAVYIDATRFLTRVPREEFIAQTLAIELYLEAGVRAVEIGTLLADRDPQTGKNRYPALEYLRLAIPRRVYTNNHMDVAAAALVNIFNRREQISSGYRIIREAPIMRHFTVELEPVKAR
ncbi:MAG: tyrosine phenol-lyase [Bacteroides sp. SM23_62]|nr:MAG: tyrosine phenol-lyase [Bacteroides sp. SM23_62]